MHSKEEAKQKIAELIDDFNRHPGKDRLSEDETRTFIDKMFEALGWNFKTSEVSKQEKVFKGFVDYGFKINNVPVMFVEAKKTAESIINPDFYNQVTDYAWHKATTWAVLTNFKHIRIINAYIKGNYQASILRDIEIQDYLNNFDSLWLLSKESFENKLIDKVAEAEGKKAKEKPVEKVLFEDINKWRQELAKDIKKNYGEKYSTEETDEMVQTLLDRFILVRKIEDEGLTGKKLEEAYHNWQSASSKKTLWMYLRELFTTSEESFDQVYDSKIFEYSEVDKLEISDVPLATILKGLYESEDHTIRYNFSLIDADILGNIYEQYLGYLLKTTAKRAKGAESKAKRKEHGIYYTPRYIVDYIIKNTLGEKLKECKTWEEVEKIKVLDPACGSGSFLIRAFDEIYNWYEEHGMKKDTLMANEHGFETVKDKIIKKNLFGVDLDQKAVGIAQLNLLLKTADKKHELPMLQENIKCGNSLIDDEKIAGDKAFKWEKEYKEVIDKGGFDIVVGNPPYFNISANDILKKNKYFKTLSQGVVNSATLFLKKGLDLLKNGGYLGFIIPKSFLIVESWSPIRELILEMFQVKQVYDVGMAFEEVGLEQVVIILQKTASEKNTVRVVKSGREINTIPQVFFKGRNAILTSLDKQKYDLILKIERDSIELGSISDAPRGITVKSTEYKREFTPAVVQVLGGTNLERYKITPGNKRKPDRFLNKNDARIQQKHSIFRQRRVVYQNIASSVPKIVATIVSAAPTDDTLNNLQINTPHISYEYVLSILNSKMVTFYLRYAIINCSLLTIHLDKPYLGKIPLKNIPLTQQQPIIKLVDKMLSLNKRLAELGDKQTSERQRLEEEIKRTDAEIDELVYKLYGITDEERKIIEASLER